MFRRGIPMVGQPTKVLVDGYQRSPVANDPDAVSRKLDQIMAELQELRIEIAQSKLSRHQLECLRTIMPAIFAAIGDAVFTVASLRADVVAAKHVGLAAALDRAGSGKSLGRLLDAAADIVVDDYVVRRVSSVGANGAAVWKIERV